MPDDAPKVLYVSFDVIPDPSGHSSRSTELLRGLSPVFNVDALTSKTPDHSHIERYYGVRLMRVPVGNGELPDRAQAFERAVRRQLESEEYPLVVFADPHGGYALCELKQRLGFKVIYLAAGFPSIELRYTHPELERERKFLAKLQRHELFCLMNADRVLVGAELTRQYAVGLGVQQERVQVVPPPVDRKLFEGVPAVGTESPLRLLYLGSNAPWQGLPNLLFAFRQALQRCDARLSLVGPRGPSGQRKQLEDLIRDLKLAGKVELLDPVAHDDIPRLLAGAHALVAPLERGDRNLKQGAAPLKIAEALCAGRPVITTDLPITKAMLQDGVHGLFVRPGDAEDLARAIAQLAADVPLRQRLGASARAHALERFDADHGRRTLLVAAHELIGRVMEPGAAEERSVDVDLYTVSNMPTSIGALPHGHHATPDGGDGPTQAGAAPPPPPSARRPKLRPQVATRSAGDETNPGAKLPASNVEIEASVFSEEPSASATGLAELPGAMAELPAPPVAEATPVGPAPLPHGPPVEQASDEAPSHTPAVEFTPVGAPAHVPPPALEAPVAAVEFTPVGPAPHERPAALELTPVGPPPHEPTAAPPAPAWPATGWPLTPAVPHTHAATQTPAWPPQPASREPLPPVQLTTPAPPKTPTLVGVGRVGTPPPPPRAAPRPTPPPTPPPLPGSALPWPSTPPAWPSASEPPPPEPTVPSWPPAAPPPAAWTPPAAAVPRATPPPGATPWAPSPSPAAPPARPAPPPGATPWAAAPPPVDPAAPRWPAPPVWPTEEPPVARPPARPHGPPPVVRAAPVVGPPPGWNAGSRPVPAVPPPHVEPAAQPPSDADWFDRLMRGEPPPAAEPHANREEPSQVVVGAALEEPADGTSEARPPGLPPRR